MFKFFKKIFALVILIILFLAVIRSGGLSADLNMKKVLLESRGIVKDWVSFGKGILGVSSENNRSVKQDNISKDNYHLQFLANSIDEDSYDFSGTEDSMITLINKERFDAGLKPLKKNSLLMKSALDKAWDMKKYQYFEHISDKEMQPWFFAERAGYQYQEFGENIAVKYFSANSVHKAFMDSPGHKENILNNDFNDVGVAILPFESKDERRYIVVEHFGHFLRDIDLNEETVYDKKNKFRCRVQKKKREELKTMISHCEGREESLDNTLTTEVGNDIGSVEEGNLYDKDLYIKRLIDLKTIEEKINQYLEVCEIIKKRE